MGERGFLEAEPMGGEGQSGLVRPNSAQGFRQSWLVSRDALPRQQSGTKVCSHIGPSECAALMRPMGQTATKSKKNGLHAMEKGNDEYEAAEFERL